MVPDNSDGDGANIFGNDNTSSLRLQVIGIAAWPAQALLFGIASVYRYSGEPGGMLMQSPLPEGAAFWRPEVLDWPVLPIIAAGLTITAWLYRRRNGPDVALFDLSRVGPLLCLSVFALSNGSTPVFLSTLSGLWVCVAWASVAKFQKTVESFTAIASTVVTCACLLSAYMHLQRGCSVSEIMLIAASVTCGVFSTGLRASPSRASSMALPVWFTLLLTLLWWTAISGHPSLRMLVALELSAAFVAGRHAALFRLAMCFRNQ